jgi:STE24 endopeptidase
VPCEGDERTAEIEADLYVLNASRQPHGLAEFMIQRADVEKLVPSALEELVFYAHPSVGSRASSPDKRQQSDLPPFFGPRIK